eukprot:g1545.t1
MGLLDNSVADNFSVLHGDLSGDIKPAVRLNGAGKGEGVSDSQTNPFSNADPDRAEIWDMLVMRDINAFIAADWSQVEDDFDVSAFFGVDGGKFANPDEWALGFPDLETYKEEWLRQAQEFAATEFAEDARAAIFEATDLSAIEVKVLATETNTFSPIRVDIEAFRASLLAAPGKHPQTPTLCSAVVTVGRKFAQANGWDLVEGTAAWADPAGLVARQTFEALRDEILGQVEAQLPFDVVVIGLHGAMVADGYDDPEGDFLSRLRGLVGPDTPIIATFDPHSHLTERRVEAADALIAFKEFPHIDFVDRAEDAWKIAARTVAREIKPVMSVYDPKMIDVFPTTSEPMRQLVDDMIRRETETPDLLSLSVVHGFMAGDVPEMGSKILAVTDANPDLGAAVSREFGERLFGLRGKVRSQELTPAEAIEKALVHEGGPVTIADMWDNPGGGTAGDATILLAEAIRRDLSNIAFGSIWDPVAVQLCHVAGEGACMQLRFGAKSAPETGAPIDAEVEIVRNIKNAEQRFGESHVPIGDASLIRVGGIEVILNSTRAQCFDTTLFSNFGIDPNDRKILAVMATNIKVAQDYFDRIGRSFRPHIKTHKIPALAAAQRAAGAKGINCQKISEAEVFADAGFTDILITFNMLGTARLNRLLALNAKVDLQVVADNTVVVDGLASVFSKDQPLKILVECDTGSGRNGVQSPADAVELAKRIDASEGLQFHGIMTYPRPSSEAAVEEFFSETIKQLAPAGMTCSVVSHGGSPSLFDSDLVQSATEHRAGTYIFNDRAMVRAGMCDFDDCAMHVLATVVSRPTDTRAVLDAGSKALTSDLLGFPDHGLLIDYPEASIATLSEEHAVVDLSNSDKKPDIGERVRIIPNHTCVVSNLYDKLVFHRDGVVTRIEPVAARGQVV